MKADSKIPSQHGALLVTDINSYGRGLANLQEILQLPGFELIEVVPRGSGLTLLVGGAKKQLDDLVRDLSTEDRERLSLIEKPAPSLLRFLYSLESASLASNLLIIEAEFAGTLLSCANRALLSDIAIVDLKIPRGQARTGSLVLTSANEKSLHQFRQNLEEDAWKATMIGNLAPGFEKYF